MCRALARSCVAVAGAIGALAASPCTGVGQDRSAEYYRTRVDRLTRMRDSIKVVQAQEDSASRTGRIDTITVGTLVVYTEPDWTGVVAAGVRRVWEQLAPGLGADTVLLSGFRLYVIPENAPDRLPRGTGRDIRRVHVNRWHRERETLANLLLSRIRTYIGNGLPVSYTGWPTLPLDSVSDRTWELIYVELVTVPSPAARGCLGGDLQACRTALVLVPTDSLATLLDRNPPLYGPHEIRRMVEEDESYFARYHQATYRDCILGESDPACLELMLGAFHLPLALRTSSRTALLAAAFRLGGDSARTRFLEWDGGDLVNRLEVAARAPIDSVVAAWYNRVVASQPEPTTLPRTAGWTAFAWVVLLAFAASRSTRWRLG